MADIPQICPKCHTPFLPNVNFCPNCGYHIAEITQPISIGRQIYQYIFSLVLPPFGLVWAFKYFRSGHPQQKRVGWIIVALTCVSFIFTIWFLVGMFQSIQSQVNSYSNLGL